MTYQSEDPRLPTITIKCEVEIDQMTKVVAAVATVYCAPAVIAAVSSGGAAVIGATVTTITSAAQLLQGTPAYV